MKQVRRVVIAVLLSVFIAAFFGCGPGPTSGAYLTVSQYRCVGCGECVKVCNANAVTMLNNKAVIDPSNCINCGQCVDACPYDAIE